MLYMKRLRQGGEGEWEQIQLDPSQHTAEQLLHDLYMANGWADSSEEEYQAQLASVKVEEVVEPVVEESNEVSE